MTPLAFLAREIGCAVLVVRHFNKGSGQQALLRGAGTLGGLAGAARMVIALAGDPESDDDRARVFGVVKSSFEAKPASLRVLIESAPVEGFQMTVSRASWHGESSAAISDLMERTREEHQGVLDAEDALREILEKAAEPVASSDVHQAMKRKGHGRNAVYNAAKALHVAVDRSGFPARTTWALEGIRIVDAGTTADAVVAPGGTTGTTAVVAPDLQSSPPETTGRRARAHAGDDPLDMTETTGMTGTTGEVQSSLSSLSSGHPLPARAREEPALVVVPETPDDTPVESWCRSFVDHQLRHRDVQTDSPWCEICSPRTPA